MEASVEATRVVERTVEAARDSWVSPTVAPTGTPVVMSTLAPTPEPYVVVPGSMERGAGVVYDCLVNDEIFRDIFLSSFNSGDDPLLGAMIEDRDLFVRGMMSLADGEPDLAVMLSVYSGFGSGFCGTENADSSLVVEDALGFWVAAYGDGLEGVAALLDADLAFLEAERERLKALSKGIPGRSIGQSYEDALGMEYLEAGALLGELFECYGLNSDVRDIMDSHVPNDSSVQYFQSAMLDHDLFVLVSRAYARQEDDGAERLAELDLVLEAMCR